MCLKFTWSRKLKNELLKLIDDANKEKHYSQLERRTLKLCEEAGESAQAILSLYSHHNIKNKTIDCYLEEVTDTVIVGIDILLTRFPGEESLTLEELEEKRLKIFKQKLSKWSDIKSRIQS